MKNTTNIFLIILLLITSCNTNYTSSEAKLFYVGEGANANNNFTPRTQSFFDENWLINYGGVDFPERRNGFNPADFIPNQNPLYVAIPYASLEDFNKIVEVKYGNKKCKAEIKDRSENEFLLISPALRDCLKYVNGSINWRINE